MKCEVIECYVSDGAMGFIHGESYPVRRIVAAVSGVKIHITPHGKEVYVGEYVEETPPSPDGAVAKRFPRQPPRVIGPIDVPDALIALALDIHHKKKILNDCKPVLEHLMAYNEEKVG